MATKRPVSRFPLCNRDDWSQSVCSLILTCSWFVVHVNPVRIPPLLTFPATLRRGVLVRGVVAFCTSPLEPILLCTSNDELTLDHDGP